MTPRAQNIWNFIGFHAIYHVIVPALKLKIRKIVVDTSERQYRNDTREPANMFKEINGIVILANVLILVAPRLKEASSSTASTCCNPANADLTVKGIFLTV